MNKIVFCNIMMRKEIHKFCYTAIGNNLLASPIEVAFPINSVLARQLKRGDNVRVILLKTDDLEKNSDNNIKIYKDELNEINRGIGANIEYRIISSPYKETRDTHEMLLRLMIDELYDNAEVFSDITYGPKPLPIVLFAVLNFSEKFFGCKIANIIYGKVDYVATNGGYTVPCNPELFEVTALYYLNSLTNTMECSSSEQAKKMLSTLLEV